MATDENNIYRVILNWITPIAAAMSVVKLATKMIVKDLTWTGAILTTIVSVLMGISFGSITYVAYIESISDDSMSALWRALFVTSAMTMIGDKISTWFVYGLEVDKALNEICIALFQKIKKIF